MPDLRPEEQTLLEIIKQHRNFLSLLACQSYNLRLAAIQKSDLPRFCAAGRLAFQLQATSPLKNPLPREPSFKLRVSLRSTPSMETSRFKAS